MGIAILTVAFAFAAADKLPQESTSAVIDVLPSALEAKPPGENWLSYNGDFSGRRYSSLSQINLGNVDKLKAQWVFHASNSNRLEATPVVVNGVMLVTSANDTLLLTRVGPGNLASCLANFSGADR